MCAQLTFALLLLQLFDAPVDAAQLRLDGRVAVSQLVDLFGEHLYSRLAVGSIVWWAERDRGVLQREGTERKSIRFASPQQNFGFKYVWVFGCVSQTEAERRGAKS